MTTAQRAVQYAKSKLGGKYSQTFRWRNNPYTRDCASFVYSSYEAAGHKMKYTTSNTEVNDPGFDLLFPGKSADIGKKFYKWADIKAAGITPQPGDLVFYNQKATTRKNKITHVTMVYDDKQIIHARNSTLGILLNTIDLYNGTICAITRFREGGQTAEPRILKLTDPRMVGEDVKALQTRLKEFGFGKHLGTFGPNRDGVDGEFGPKTHDAVLAFQRAQGLDPDGKVGPKTRTGLGL